MDSFGEPCYRWNGTVYKNEISKQLAAYEDTGMTPDEINRMVEGIECKPVEAAPVVYAHWVKNRTCSACDKTYFGFDIPKVAFKFCPNCGAKIT